MTTLVRPAGPASGLGMARISSFLGRLVKVHLKAKSLQQIAHLDDHILRDIGMSEDLRHVLQARREAELNRLRMRAQTGPFFVPPA